ncbi:MAG: 50S ribosomal protein L32 [Candidatus Komeilibacteria bacterium CG10_big_fil_rev_8_21_14_0_10_41_13]|uniref:Large ribosomal subunit protein bL32 n=1 Tax=Candidatus Komeilibacteria bacterium CG10_big_fil_rev_8_21_14_0_10_41_13 TaxID=1974476 RepID=A0A2M6WBL2_9BACT|nr:MAG: 50S ribosomal protein L32 [Candidatus Komeilibacteria bacterium CG10_big_fil_rev_8_21_14_0_10_41_13]
MVQKKKRTSGQRKRRASHFALRVGAVNKCPNCQKPIRPYHACAACGYYKGKEVIKVALKTKKAKATK